MCKIVLECEIELADLDSIRESRCTSQYTLLEILMNNYPYLIIQQFEHHKYIKVSMVTGLWT